MAKVYARSSLTAHPQASKILVEPNNCSAALNLDFIIFNKWFFICNKGQHFGPFNPQTTVVHNGEDFGFHVVFAATKPTLIFKIELTVPNSPENFPCPQCKPGEVTINENTVNVNTLIDSAIGWFGFYWGIGANDPRGIYKLRFSVDGFLIDSYVFEVK